MRRLNRATNFQHVKEKTKADPPLNLSIGRLGAALVYGQALDVRIKDKLVTAKEELNHITSIEMDTNQ